MYDSLPKELSDFIFSWALLRTDRRPRGVPRLTDAQVVALALRDRSAEDKVTIWRFLTGLLQLEPADQRLGQLWDQVPFIGFHYVFAKAKDIRKLFESVRDQCSPGAGLVPGDQPVPDLPPLCEPRKVEVRTPGQFTLQKVEYHGAGGQVIEWEAFGDTYPAFINDPSAKA